MTSSRRTMYRRDFVRTLAGGAAALGGASVLTAATRADPAPKPAMKLALGFDNFSVRALGLKAPALVDYAPQALLVSVIWSLRMRRKTAPGRTYSTDLPRLQKTLVNLRPLCPIFSTPSFDRATKHVRRPAERRTND